MENNVTNINQANQSQNNNQDTNQNTNQAAIVNAKKPMSKKRKIAIAACLTVLVLGGGAAVLFLVGKGDKAVKVAEAAAEVAEATL